MKNKNKNKDIVIVWFVCGVLLLLGGVAIPLLVRLKQRDHFFKLEHWRSWDYQIEGKIGYIKLRSFQSSTPQEIRSAVPWFQARGVEGLVLDLRGNHGGNFLVAIDTTNLFLNHGVICYIDGVGNHKSRDGRVAVGKTIKAQDMGLITERIPLVVIIDKGTASSAELLATSLRDNQVHRAVAGSLGLIKALELKSSSTDFGQFKEAVEDIRLLIR